MKNVQIILDSACDMQKPEADALGVTLLPLRTNFGGEVFLDGITMTHDEFFEKLTQAKTLPTTSQIPPFDFEEAFRRLHAAGAEILVITLSSKLSGTYQSAVIAAQETGIDVTIVDSENVTAGERVLDEAYLRDGQEVANRTKAKVYDGLYALDTLREIWDDIRNGKPPCGVEKIPGQQAAERKG